VHVVLGMVLTTTYVYTNGLSAGHHFMPGLIAINDCRNDLSADHDFTNNYGVIHDKIQLF